MEPVSRVPPSVGVGVESENKNKKTSPDVAGISPRDRRLIPDQDVILASGKRAIARSMPALLPIDSHAQRRLEWRMGWQREAHLARLSFQCLGIRDATRYRVVSSGEKLRGSVGWAGEAAKKTKPKRPPGELKGGERRGRSSRGKQAASCRYRYLCCPRWTNSSKSHSTAMTHGYAQLLALDRVDRFRGARAKPASASLRSRALRGVQPVHCGMATAPRWHVPGAYCSRSASTAACNRLSRESRPGRVEVVQVHLRCSGMPPSMLGLGGY